jgi:hypothetical protein
VRGRENDTHINREREREREKDNSSFIKSSSNQQQVRWRRGGSVENTNFEG